MRRFLPGLEDALIVFKKRGPPNRYGPPGSSSADYLLLQLRLKIRQIKVLSVGLNSSLLVDLEDADAVHEEDITRLGFKT